MGTSSQDYPVWISVSHLVESLIICSSSPRVVILSKYYIFLYFPIPAVQHQTMFRIQLLLRNNVDDPDTNSNLLSKLIAVPALFLLTSEFLQFKDVCRASVGSISIYLSIDPNLLIEIYRASDTFRTMTTIHQLIDCGTVQDQLREVNHYAALHDAVVVSDSDD
jgi:hypothetical protein